MPHHAAPTPLQPAALLFCCSLLCTATAAPLGLLPAAASFTEAELRAGGVAVTLRLTGDTWAAGQEAAVVAGLTGAGTDPAGWEARKATAAAPAAGTPPGADMVVTLGPDPAFDISAAEDVTVDIPGTATQSGAKPAAAGGAQLRFSITPTAGALSFALLRSGNPVAAPVVVSEAELSSGLPGPISLRLTLAVGETWRSPPGDSDRLSLLAGVSGGVGWDAGKAVVLPGASALAVSPDGLILTASFAADPGFGVAAQEAVAGQLPGAGHPGTLVQSALAPGGQPWGFAISPSASGVALVSPANPLVVDEAALRRGGVALTLRLDPWEAWVPPAVGVVAAAMGSDGAEAAGWDARRASLVQQAPVLGGGGRDLVVALSPDAGFDISAVERVTVALPPGAVESGLALLNTVTFEITPAQGAFSLSVSSGTAGVSEVDIRAGGLQLTLSLQGEVWSGTACADLAAGMSVAVPGGAAGFGSRKGDILSGGCAVAPGGRDAVFTFVADAGFDIASAEAVACAVPASAVLSGLLPQPAVAEFRIAAQGVVSLSPATLTEAEFASGTAVLTLRVSGGDTWAPGAQDLIVSAFTTASAQPAGFAARRSTLLQPGGVVISGAEVSVSISRDAAYSIAQPETIRVDVVPAMLASGLQPDVAGGQPELVVTPDPPTVRQAAQGCFAESDVRSGSAAFTLVLSDGEAWADLTSVVSAAVPNSSTPNGFSGRRAVLLPPDASTLQVSAANSQHLVVSLAADPLYDIAVPESVALPVPGAAVASGTVPLAGQAAPLGFCVAPSAAAVSAGDAVFTETELRQGGACLTLVLDAGESWLPFQRVQWLDAMRVAGAPGGAAGWGQRAASLLPDTTSVSGQAQVLCFAADKLFDISGSETVRVTPPGSAVASGLPPTGSPAFTIAAATGGVRVAAPSVLPEGSVRLGGARLTLLLEDDVWASPLPVEDMAAGFACGGVEEGGFNKRRGVLLGSASFEAVSAQEVRVRLAQDNGFDVSLREDCTVNLPAGAVESGMLPGGAAAFSIEPSVVYVTDGNATFTDEQLRTGDAGFDLTLENDLFAPAGVGAFLAAFAASSSEAAEPQGFDARKGMLLPAQAAQLANATLMRVTFTADPEYRICHDERITLRVPDEAVQSGRAPTVLPRSQGPLSFAVLRTPSLVSFATGAREAAANETALREGAATLTLTLSGGGVWAPGAWDAIAARSSGSLGAAGPWGMWGRAAFNSVVTGATLVLAGSPVPLFDVPRAEAVTLHVPDEALSCGALPDDPSERQLLLTVSPTQGDVSSTCRGTSFDFADFEVRRGNVRLELELSGEAWTSRYQDYYNSISASNQASGGFAQLKPTVLSVSESFSVTGSVLALSWLPAPTYASDLPLSVSIAFPPSMVASGVLPRVQGCPLVLRILPGRARLTSTPAYLLDSELRSGGARLTLTLEGDTWAPLDAAAFLQKLGAEGPGGTQGFEANRASLLGPGSLQQDAAAARQLVVVFGAAPGYAVTGGQEVLTLAASSGDVVGPHAPLGEARLVVARANEGLRFAQQGSFFTREGESRTLVSLVLGAVVVELVDSAGNPDTSLSEGYVEVAAANSSVSLVGATVAPVTRGTATFSALEVGKGGGTTDLLFQLRGAGVPAASTVLKASVTFGVGVTAPPATPTPGTVGTAGPGLGPVVRLAPIPPVTACLPSVVLDASMSAVANGSFVWYTNASQTLQAVLQRSTDSRVVVPSGAAEKGAHSVCVEDIASGASDCGDLLVGLSGVHIAEGPAFMHVVQEDLSLHAVPLNGTLCTAESHDYLGRYSYTWSASPPLPLGVGSAALTIPGGTLLAGMIYRITVEACPDGAPPCKAGSVVVTAAAAPLTAVPSVDAVSLGVGGVVEVSVGARRGPLVVVGHRVQWACTEVCGTLSAVVAGSGLPFILRRSDFLPGSHTIVLNVSHMGHLATTTIDLQATEAPVSLLLRSPSHPGQSTVPAAELYTLEAVDPQGDTAADLQWRVTPAPAGPVLTTPLLAVRQGLAPGTRYAATAATLQTEATRHITTHPLPAGGTCSAEGAPGSRVAIRCTGWASHPPLSYRFMQLHEGKELDIAGGWVLSPTVTTYLPAGEGTTAGLAVYVRDRVGATARVAMQVAAGGPPQLSARQAVLNGDRQLAAQLLRWELQTSPDIRTAADTLASLADSAAPSELAQVAGVLCALRDSPGLTAAEAPLEPLSKVVLAVVQRLEPAGVEPAVRHCLVEGVASVAGASADLAPPASRALRSATDAVMQMGPSLAGSPAEVVHTPALSVAFAAHMPPVGGALRVSLPNSSASVTVSPSNGAKRVLRFGLAVWHTFPAGLSAPLEGTGGTARLLSKVVGVTISGVLPLLPVSGEAFVITVPLLANPANSVGVYYDPAASTWGRSGVEYTGSADGAAVLRATHLTEFALVQEGGGGSGTDLRWLWVLLPLGLGVVALGVWACCRRRADPAVPKSPPPDVAGGSVCSDSGCENRGLPSEPTGHEGSPPAVHPKAPSSTQGVDTPTTASSRAVPSTQSKSVTADIPAELPPPTNPIDTAFVPQSAPLLSGAAARRRSSSGVALGSPGDQALQPLQPPPHQPFQPATDDPSGSPPSTATRSLLPPPDALRA